VVSIDERAVIIDNREPFGDWEIDTVSGQHGTGAMVIFWREKAVSKSAKDVTTARIELLIPDKEDVQTISADKGRKFANHDEIAKALEAEVYFGHPYR